MMRTSTIGGYFTVICIFVLQHVSCQYGGCRPPAHQCTLGYTRDANGCTVCVTSNTNSEPGTVANPAGDPFHQGGASLARGGQTMNTAPTSMTYVMPCITGTTCDLICDYGYLSGPMNTCQYCICAAPPDKAVYKTPCTGQPDSCDLPCPHGYVLGQNGCHICACASIPTTVVPTTPSRHMSEEECTMKITKCQITFPFGFMTDVSCELCVGKDEIYNYSSIPEERQPMIQLANPCIQGFDLCRIACATGYRTGPRKCQYCACNN